MGRNATPSETDLRENAQISLNSHVFHYECLRDWLEQNNNCPVCWTTLNELMENDKILRALEKSTIPEHVQIRRLIDMSNSIVEKDHNSKEYDIEFHSDFQIKRMISITDEEDTNKLLKTTGEHTSAPLDIKAVGMLIEEDGDGMKQVYSPDSDPTKGSVLKTGVRASKSMKT